MAGDSRWALARRVAAGPHFARSTLLSNFLLYVVSETLAGRPHAISERKIGMVVFGRPASYSTDDDNIVRNYARQLRKRLSEHFAGLGSAEPIHISIPVGGYVPAFVISSATRSEDRKLEPILDKSRPSSAADAEGEQVAAAQPALSGGHRINWRGALLLALVLAVAAAGGLSVYFRPRARQDPDPSRLLWKTLLGGPGTTLIVPPDAGFNLLEDISEQTYPLASYMKGGFSDVPGRGLSRHALLDLHSQQYTDFVSMQIAADVARLPEFDPQRVLFRFPRELQIEDLKRDNALIIGSVSSNPWAGFVDANANFHIQASRDMEKEEIVNSKPLPGEESIYQSHWNEPVHATYALILFLPNLSGSGHILLIEGLDVAGTQAATELLFQPQAIAQILNMAKRPDGALRSFEILLRATSIESNAAGTQVIASRIHAM